MSEQPTSIPAVTEDRVDAPWIATDFKEFEQRLNGEKTSSLHQVRRKALDYLLSVGLPTPRDEEWKYTNISTIAKSPYRLGADEQSTIDIAKYCIPDVCARLVFLNGSYSKELSSVAELPKGVRIRPLAEFLSAKGDADAERVQAQLSRSEKWENRAFVALNTAFVKDGAYICVDKNVACPNPIQILFLTTGDREFSISYPRVVGFAAEGSEVTVVETHAGSGTHEYLTSASADWSLAENATVNHVRLQQENARAFHVGTVDVDQFDNSTFRHFTIGLGGAVSRQEVRPVLNGSGIMSELYGITVIGDKQHVDNYTVIDHAKPNSQSNEVYKGIYGGSSKGIFNGTIIVRPDAQKTNAIQSNNSLLLSNNASSNAKPQLKIWADDVKCTHGATIGQLDESALFYLRARGIPQIEARRILVEAFAADVMDLITHDSIREYVANAVRVRLEQVQQQS